MLARTALALVLLTSSAVGRTLAVGPGKEFASFAAAVKATADGDTVLLDPGEYYECAATGTPNLTIAGNGPGAVLTDATCEGKAILVLRGANDTVRNLTLARARVPDGNGAGIRLEAADLHVDNVTFDNDQVGLLAGDVGGSVQIHNSHFIGGGVGGDDPKFAAMVGSVGSLHIEHSSFADVKGGQIQTRAERTELVGDQIATGAGDAPGPAVLATAGTLIMEDNTVTVGPNAPRSGAAVNVWAPGTATLRSNRLVNKAGSPLIFLLDWTDSDPLLAGNQLGPGDSELSSSGIWRHRASGTYHAAKDAVHGFASRLKRLISH